MYTCRQPAQLLTLTDITWYMYFYINHTCTYPYFIATEKLHWKKFATKNVHHQTASRAHSWIPPKNGSLCSTEQLPVAVLIKVINECHCLLPNPLNTTGSLNFGSELANGVLHNSHNLRHQMKESHHLTE